MQLRARLVILFSLYGLLVVGVSKFYQILLSLRGIFCFFVVLFEVDEALSQQRRVLRHIDGVKTVVAFFIV